MGFFRFFTGHSRITPGGLAPARFLPYFRPLAGVSAAESRAAYRSVPPPIASTASKTISTIARAFSTSPLNWSKSAASSEDLASKDRGIEAVGGAGGAALAAGVMGLFARA